MISTSKHQCFAEHLHWISTDLPPEQDSWHLRLAALYARMVPRKHRHTDPSSPTLPDELQRRW